jgi:hypothetical protein
MNKTLWKLCVVSAAVTAVFGCAKEERPDGLPDLFPCILTFTQEGKPLAGATVEVVGVDSSQWSAGGMTDGAGRVELVTYGKFKGVRAGRHKVVVNKHESEASTSDVEMEAGIVLSGQPKIFSVVEQQYTTSETTPWEVEISSGGNNDQTFECGKAVREPFAGFVGL